jgi:hypothetical protein
MELVVAISGGSPMRNDENDRLFERQPLEGDDVKRLTIAIDYDDTFTADKTGWDAVLPLLCYRHQVICVSARRDTHENRVELTKHLPTCVRTIVLAYDQPKRDAAKKAGFNVDIWIDDRPETITGGATTE